jgi:hypothetical protein
MGHGAICSNRGCSHRLGLHRYDGKKRVLVCSKCRCDRYK